ncbi:MAG: hypothetical protein V1780_02170 [Chloroflexota bacterium]
MAQKKAAAKTEGKPAVLGPTFEKGKPEGKELGKWRYKLPSREEKIRYLKTAERYWYSQDWFGSERRKNPA